VAAKPNRTRIRRAPSPTASKQSRAPVKAPPAPTAEALIPWNAPELGPALDREIDRAWAGWATAADLALQIEDAPVVARVLQALREARRLGDQKALGMLDAGARAALDQVAPAIAAETHARYAAEKTLAPGVTVADLVPKKLQRKGAGRRLSSVRQMIPKAVFSSCRMMVGNQAVPDRMLFFDIHGLTASNSF
jgi:hypothetical protein